MNICQCGCGSPIQLKPHHRYKPPRLLKGHFIKGQSGGPKRLSPPIDWRAPTGFCECGCGKRTAIATSTDARRDQYAGHPKRCLPGHHANDIKGSSSGRWNGGRRINGCGYVVVFDPQHEMSNPQGYVLEHRKIVSDLIGRPLQRNEHVHHKNGDREDNSPENLELMLIGSHPTGQRIEDIVAWAREIIRRYGHLYPDHAVLSFTTS